MDKYKIEGDKTTGFKIFQYNEDVRTYVFIGFSHALSEKEAIRDIECRWY